VVDRLVAWLAPLLRFELTGLGAFAALQINFVSFAAPLATLTMMEQRGTSERRLAATLTMCIRDDTDQYLLADGRARTTPRPDPAVVAGGGLTAAATTFYLAGRSLSATEAPLDESLQHRVANDSKGVLDVINHAGAEAFKIAIGSIPMLMLSLVAVTALRQFGAIDLLIRVLTPLLAPLAIDPVLTLPALTKYLAGGARRLRGHRPAQHRPSRIRLNASFPLARLVQVKGTTIIFASGLRQENNMDNWSKVTEFFACGVLVLPATLGTGLDSFEVFATTLALMMLLLIGVTLGAPAVVPGEVEDEDGERR
jgi:hypothetical protein